MRDEGRNIIVTTTALGDELKVYASGTSVWRRRGVMHNADGPAYIVPSYMGANGIQEWWVEGMRIRTTEQAVQLWAEGQLSDDGLMSFIEHERMR